MMLDEILENNKKFVEEFEGEKLSHHPQKKLAILTCMDCRLTGFLEPALGIGRGDAKIIKNAGNNIVDEDAIRSIAAAIFNLGAEEVMVIGHTDCGMAGSDAKKLEKTMLERGIPQEEIDKYDLKSWIGGFKDEKENVLDNVDKIKNHPLIPNDVPIHGLMIDIVSGELEIVSDDR
ncbi:beta-carbonic anhydrase 1 [Methanobrevibacter woesei]|uniref:Beta-carbonic anhydrase 1 n=1 Tax=Methanobrevibacter woesei TaxID=190976 RepID=A0A2U1S5M1_9EURY|nr:carbonic anhydrase [Methanobrevibacter woesei]MCI7292004.1 carbonic anhydrase [Methanobrevibacter woesei]PWB84835.1 beta-carbonic anhydrase 1 [Methanobrevibacter woesei]